MARGFLYSNEVTNKITYPLMILTLKSNHVTVGVTPGTVSL